MRKPNCGPQVGHQLFTCTFMPGLSRQIAALHPYGNYLALFGFHFSCVPQPNSAGRSDPSAMNASTDQVFQNSFSPLNQLDLCVSLSATCTPLTPKFFMRCAHSLLFLGSASIWQPVSLAMLIKACLTSQLAMPGFAPQQEIAVVLRFSFLTCLNNSSLTQQLLTCHISFSLLLQNSPHSIFAVSMQSTPFAWQYCVRSDDEIPKDRFTQNPSLLMKILSRISLQFSLVSPTLRKVQRSLGSGNWTGSGSMMVKVSQVKCLRMSGSAPLPIDPCPIMQMSLMCPQMRACCYINVRVINHEPKFDQKHQHR